MENVEVVISSETGGQLWSAAVWDPGSGACLMSYRGGGVAAPNSLRLVGEDYLVCAERTRPLLHMWPLNSRERLDGLRLVLPGVAGCVAVSPDGLHLLAAVDEKIHVWRTASGALAAVLAFHYQRVNRIEFCDDGSHFVSAGDDGLVVVASLADAVSGDAPAPLRVFSDHALPVKDVHVGKGGLRSRLFSVSADRSCRICDLASGETLLSVVFERVPTAVTADPTETEVFVGTADGEIYKFSTANPPRNREFHASDEGRPAVLSGHSDAVTALCCSADGRRLVSGSNDRTLIVWDVRSGQRTRAIPHGGAVANALFVAAPRNMFSDAFEPMVVPHGLRRNVEPEDETEVLNADPVDFWKTSARREISPDRPHYLPALDAPDPAKADEELRRMKKINSDLYNFAIDNIFKDIRNK